MIQRETIAHSILNLCAQGLDSRAIANALTDFPIEELGSGRLYGEKLPKCRVTSVYDIVGSSHV